MEPALPKAVERSGLGDAVLLTMSKASRPVLWTGIAFLVLILLAWAGSARGAMYTRWVQDIFIPLEGVIHLQHGQLPHVDFGTPVGVLYYVIQYLPTLVAPLSARTVIWSNAIVAVVAFAVAAYAARDRLPAWLAASVSLYVGLVALSTRQLGEKLTFVTNNASYNRWSWALIAVLALLVALPHPRALRRTATVDGAIVGVLLAALFLIKITYFVAAFGLFALALVTVRRAAPLRFGAVALLVLGVVLLAVQLSTGLIGAYLAEMRATVAVQPSKLRPGFAYALGVAFAPGGLVVVLLALLAPRAPASPWSILSPVAMAGAIFAMGWAVAVQNHPELENPLLPIAAVVAWYAGRAIAAPAAADRGTADGERFAAWLRGLAAPLAIGGVLLIPMAQDIASLVWTARAATVTDPKLAWLQTTPLRDLRMMAMPGEIAPPVFTGEFASDLQFLDALGDGTALLRRHIGARHDVTVLPLTWNNPWPALLDLRPVRHELAWWDAERTFNTAIHPDPALLDGTDYVLVPKRYYSWGTTLAMLSIYGPTLGRTFHPVGETAGWTLYARNDCAARRLC